MPPLSALLDVRVPIVELEVSSSESLKLQTMNESIETKTPSAFDCESLMFCSVIIFLSCLCLLSFFTAVLGRPVVCMQR